MKYKLSDYFVLSSSCTITRGFNRSLIIDLLRNKQEVISNQYNDLIQLIDRKKIEESFEMIDNESHEFFKKFLDFMFESEYAFAVEDIELFPRRKEHYSDENIIIQDAIIEIHESHLNIGLLQNRLKELELLRCETIQVKILSISSYDFIESVLNIINKYSFLYIELLVKERNGIDNEQFISLIDRFPSLTNVYVFNEAQYECIKYSADEEGSLPLLIGNLYMVMNDLSGQHCGVITPEYFEFYDEKFYYDNKRFNSCLYKKVTIDIHGCIKNCPYDNISYNEERIIDAVSSQSFQRKWYIHKDLIDVCKDCEYRYNCSDCRTFTVTKDDDFSKPLKCGYNPYTNEWINHAEKVSNDI